MTFKSLLSVFYIALLLISCGSNNSNKKSDFSIKTNAKSNKIVLGDTLSLSIINSKNHKIKSISYQILGAPISENEVLDTEKLGKQTIEATISYNEQTETVKKDIVILNNEKPKVYAYNIVNEYPHDITSYTQGLEFYNGKLYESTGQYKESKLRIVNYETGAVLK
ncbi:MAG: glutaminyl-peptide cyclotransferase, partial [Flavobacteriaceae bacterium]|nr:glutaminyl-peptide cyclotransferase [Flavobacteriaceae bacterium]